MGPGAEDSQHRSSKASREVADSSLVSTLDSSVFLARWGQALGEQLGVARRGL